jgi:hypothetical protein
MFHPGIIEFEQPVGGYRTVLQRDDTIFYQQIIIDVIGRELWFDKCPES